MGARRAKGDVDWKAVERAYRRSAAPVTEIARRHGMNPSTLYRRARKEGWRREVAAGKGRARAPAVGLRPKAAVFASRNRRPSLPGGGRGRRPGPAACTKEPRPAGSRSELSDDLARLRSLAEKLRVRLERVIEGEQTDTVLGEREGPFTHLVKLCQVTEKILALERQLVGEAAVAEAVDLSEHDKAILERFKRRLHAL